MTKAVGKIFLPLLLIAASGCAADPIRPTEASTGRMIYEIRQDEHRMESVILERIATVSPKTEARAGKEATNSKPDVSELWKALEDSVGDSSHASH